MEPAGREIRRQDRGARRIEQIVDAAAQVFLEKGYEHASTNLIASQAGISPGSLYQFFRNKEAIAQALAERYAGVFAKALDEAFAVKAEPVEVASMIDRVVDTLVAVNVAHPALRTVFRGWDAPPALAAAITPLTDGIYGRVVAIIAARLPHLGEAYIRRISLVAIGVFRGVVPLALTGEPQEREVFVAEMKTVLTAYIAATSGGPADALELVEPDAN
jgi:AcrR family transcriptional regulator